MCTAQTGGSLVPDDPRGSEGSHHMSLDVFWPEALGNFQADLKWHAGLIIIHTSLPVSALNTVSVGHV